MPGKRFRAALAAAFALASAPARLLGQETGDAESIARAMAALAVMGSLAACAALYPAGSWVEPMADADAAPVAAAIEDFVRKRTPPPAALTFDPLPEEQAHNALTARLKDSLRRAGYAVTEAEALTPDGRVTVTRRLRYMVTQHGNGFVGRVWFDGAEVSCAFSRNAKGALIEDGPLLVWELRK